MQSDCLNKIDKLISNLHEISWHDISHWRVNEIIPIHEKRLQMLGEIIIVLSILYNYRTQKFLKTSDDFINMPDLPGKINELQKTFIKYALEDEKEKLLNFVEALIERMDNKKIIFNFNELALLIISRYKEQYITSTTNKGDS